MRLVVGESRSRSFPDFPSLSFHGYPSISPTEQSTLFSLHWGAGIRLHVCSPLDSSYGFIGLNIGDPDWEYIVSQVGITQNVTKRQDRPS